MFSLSPCNSTLSASTTNSVLGITESSAGHTIRAYLLCTILILLIQFQVLLDINVCVCVLFIKTPIGRVHWWSYCARARVRGQHQQLEGKRKSHYDSEIACNFIPQTLLACSLADICISANTHTHTAETRELEVC